MSITPLRSYRAPLVPPGTDYEQIEAKADQGALPTIRLKASNSGRAELAAHHVTGLSVFKVEQVEGAMASVHHLVPSQPLQAGAVGSPVGGTAGGYATVVVEVYALGAGVTVATEGCNLGLAQGAFELEANGKRLVINPLHCRKADWLVAAVEGDVAAIGQPVEAVDQEQLAEFGNGLGHRHSFGWKTAILSLPQGLGKTTIAKALAPMLGCKAIVDEWSPDQPAVPGALHLTNVPLEGGAA